MVSRAHWESKVKLGDLTVALGGWTSKHNEGDMPPWTMLQRARLWTKNVHEELRAFLMASKPRIEKVQTGEADVLAVKATLSASGKESKRSVMVFDGTMDIVPNAVMGMGYSLGIAEATPAGAAMAPMTRHLLGADVPLLVWGAPNVVRHEAHQLERDYPHLRRQFITWFIVPTQNSKMCIEPGKAAAEKLLLLVCPSYIPQTKVCLGFGRAHCALVFQSSNGISRSPLFPFNLSCYVCIVHLQLVNYITTAEFPPAGQPLTLHPAIPAYAWLRALDEEARSNGNQWALVSQSPGFVGNLVAWDFAPCDLVMAAINRRPLEETRDLVATAISAPRPADLSGPGTCVERIQSLAPVMVALASEEQGGSDDAPSVSSIQF